MPWLVRCLKPARKGLEEISETAEREGLNALASMLFEAEQEQEQDKDAA